MRQVVVDTETTGLDPQVHGITLEDLEASPRFAEIAAEFLQFVRGAQA